MKKLPMIFVISLSCLLVLLLLMFFPLRSALAFPAVLCLKGNLDFIGNFISRYPWLATVAVALILLGLFMRNFNLNSTTVKIMGMELQLKQTENKVKTQIKNFLSTKRSIFVFYDDYDNCYDCINSMYEIFKFLRKQLANFDSFSQTQNPSYKHIEGMVREMGRFLTKYQSDYRRYYQLELKKHENDFIPFKDIQNGYRKIGDMITDFHRLNHYMEPHAHFFDIDIKKWKGWY